MQGVRAHVCMYVRARAPMHVRVVTGMHVRRVPCVREGHDTDTRGCETSGRKQLESSRGGGGGAKGHTPVTGTPALIVCRQHSPFWGPQKPFPPASFQDLPGLCPDWQPPSSHLDSPCFKKYFRGTYVAQSVKHLTLVLAQVVTPGSWDRALSQAPC